MAEHEVVEDVIRLIDEGIVMDRSSVPLRPVATVVASKTNKDCVDTAGKFVEALKAKYPYAAIVVGDTSPAEREAAVTAGLLRMPYEVVQKGEKGEWDGTADIRDERVVAKSTHVILLDESARSKKYRTLATRTGKFIQSTT
jgi:hypothetical protein